ncbi:MAG: galactokinase [Promethearchaeota archaeon]
MPSIEDWTQLFKDKARAASILEADYGKDYYEFDKKHRLILDLLKFHGEKFGNEDIIIVRAPGRLNLMGRHIDHQGGNVNLLAIDKEFFITASIREDIKIIAYNKEESKFHKIEFDPSIIELNVNEEWTSITNDHQFLQLFRSLQGDWENYIKAALLKLLHSYTEQQIKGANICIVGTIPVAAGLSSSSALVIGILRALISLNKIEIADYELINLASKAEWFVGTRGGASDHAAIILGQINKISHVSFFPLQLIDYVQIPKEINILLVNSNILADKSGSKKERFNQKVIAYDIALELIKDRHPQYKDKIFHLRDINKTNLKMSDRDLLKFLKEFPEYINMDEITDLISGQVWNQIRKKYSFQTFPQTIALRKLLLYGISECERSRIFPILLQKGDIETAGYLMNISHNGDRIIKHDDNFYENAFDNEISDKDIDYLIREDINIAFTFGGYGCSIPKIDFIVDVAQNQKGVYGVQLSGAGLGGSVMILTESKGIVDLYDTLKGAYKERYNLECSIIPVKPVNGCTLYKGINHDKVIRGEYKNIKQLIINNDRKRIRHECIMCGNCCRANFEILIHAEDVKCFIQNKKIDYVQYFEIDPKCISEESLGGFHIEEANVLKRLKETYNNEQYIEKLEELKKFIDEKHIYLGESIYPLPIYTIIEKYGRNPILIPKSFIVMKDGWKTWGLVYRISFGTSRACHFLENNICNIHNIKPLECKAFPYDKEGYLRKDEFILKVCNGYKEI